MNNRKPGGAWELKIVPLPVGQSHSNAEGGCPGRGLRPFSFTGGFLRPGEMLAGIVYPRIFCHNVVAVGGSPYIKFFITITQDEDGIYIAECPSIPGCVSQGATAREAEKNIQQAIKECLEVRAAKGMPLTVAVRQIEVHL